MRPTETVPPVVNTAYLRQLRKRILAAQKAAAEAVAASKAARAGAK